MRSKLTKSWVGAVVVHCNTELSFGRSRASICNRRTALGVIQCHISIVERTFFLLLFFVAYIATRIGKPFRSYNVNVVKNDCFICGTD